MTLRLAKGVKDFAPQEKIAREKITTAVKNIYERFGFSPLETPILERYETLASKYAGGAEILKETFKLNDQGERDLALRYDLTVPFCRFVGMDKSIKFPFKRYQIDKVFRDGPLKKGRLREFYQCDADVVGIKSMQADAECIQMARLLFKEIGLDVTLQVNNRKVLDGIIKRAKVQEDKIVPTILIIDKLAKIGKDGVQKELQEELQLTSEQTNTIFELLLLNGTTKEKISTLKEKLTEETAQKGVQEIQEVFNALPKDATNVVFDISLARGLAYYTATVYEFFLTDKTYTSSLGGGGRYDNMIGDFLESKDAYPAVGISFGLEPILEVMIDKKLIEDKKTVTQLYLVPVGNTAKQTQDIANDLREQGINVDMDMNNKGVSKNLKYADYYKIPFVIIIGEDELAANEFTLKNMKSGSEEKVTLEDIKNKVQKE